ncbi:hypothetical protein ACVTO3_000342 [Campylobacter upsaliensis]
MKREQGKKASQKRLNLTPFVWGGGARLGKVKQGQARSSVWRRQTRLKRHDKFTPSGKAKS